MPIFRPLTSFTAASPVSAGQSFAWLGPFGASVDAVTSAWLSDTMQVLKINAQAFCKLKSGIHYNIQKYGSNRAALHISQTAKFGAEITPFDSLSTWAFGGTIDIPAGGYRARPGRAFHFFKSTTGEEVFRTTIWNRRGGEQYPVGAGFVPQAIEATFTKARLDMLGRPIAHIISIGLALHLQKLYESQGYNVVVT